MTVTQALNRFWSSFGLPAYDEASVPTGEDAPAFPYITYQVSTDTFGNGNVFLTASVWYRSTSWTAANNKAQEISDTIGRGGKIMPCNGGAIWIKRGKPFSQSMGDPEDGFIKRKYLNVAVEFLTAN